MPQTSNELRKEWWLETDQTGTTTAIQFLEAAGYKLRADWTWVRQTYRRGMSAAEVIEKVEEARDERRVGRGLVERTP